MDAWHDKDAAGDEQERLGQKYAADNVKRSDSGCVVA